MMRAALALLLLTSCAVFYSNSDFLEMLSAEVHIPAQDVGGRCWITGGKVRAKVGHTISKFKVTTRVDRNGDGDYADAGEQNVEFNAPPGSQNLDWAGAQWDVSPGQASEAQIEIEVTSPNGTTTEVVNRTFTSGTR